MRKKNFGVPIDLLDHAVEIPGGAFQCLPPNANAEGLDTHIVNVMGLIEHDYALPLHLFGDDAGDLRVEQILVAVDHDIGIAYGLPGEEVGAPALVPAEGAEILERVDTGGEHDGGIG